MNKTLKIIGIVIGLIVVVIGTLFFIANKKVKKFNIAQQNADFIIQNIDKLNVINEFPDNNFPDKSQIQNLVEGISQNCDWQNKDGKFVDFFTMKNIGGIDQAAYIYEYYLKCDSLRFILTYDMDKEKPELLRFDIQPLEEPNEMILFPEKQLKNRQ